MTRARAPRAGAPRPSAALAAACSAAVLGFPALALAVGGDTCQSATIIPWNLIDSPTGYSDLGTTGTGNNSVASCGMDGSDVFYQITAGRSTNLLLTTCAPGTPSTSDTILALKTSCFGNALQCNDDSPCAGDPRAVQSTIACIAVSNGSTYHLLIDHNGSTAAAPYELIVRVAGRDLTESLSKLPATGTVVARDVGSPFLHTPGSASAPVLYYSVGGCAPSGVLLAARRGTDIELWS